MRHLLAVVVFAIAAAGCGEAADTAEVSPSAEQTASGEPTTSGEPTPSADGPVTVRVQVSGGIAGIRRSHVVDTAKPPQRLPDAEVDRLVELAGSEAVRDYAGNHVERGECCDLMEYRVVIEHADGSTTEIVTNDADRPPRAYTQLLGIVTQVR